MWIHCSFWILLGGNTALCGCNALRCVAAPRCCTAVCMHCSVCLIMVDCPSPLCVAALDVPVPPYMAALLCVGAHRWLHYLMWQHCYV